MLRKEVDRLRTFRYTARDAKGTLSKGLIEAEDKDDSYKKLRENGLFCVSVEPYKELDQGRTYRMKVRDVSLFCRQISTMLSAGVMVSRALHILYDRTDNPHIKESYLQVYEDIQKGLSLYEAMREQGTVYPVLLMNMVHAGEISGTLDVIMQKMSDHYEKEYRLLGKLRASMAYPVLLLAVTFLVMIGLFVFVLPRFFIMFEGAELPVITKVIMALSNFLTQQWYIPLFLALAAFLAGIVLSRKREVRLWFDKIRMEVPLLGKQLTIIYVARFTHALAVLYSSGVPMIEATEMAASVLNNHYIADKFVQVREDVSRGDMLSEAIERTELFDSMVTAMLFIGEESGSLDEILQKLSSFYDNESETALQKLTALLEPIMMITIAIIVGVVVAAVMLPMYSMYATVV